MSYRDTSNQSGDLSEATVYLDLIKKGWVVLSPSSRDSVYDFVVESKNGFERVQVKTLSGNSLCKHVDRGNEVVSRNGKVRNSLDYAKHGIEWLAGVSKGGSVHYYHLSTYSKIPGKSFSVNKYKQDGFPTNNVPKRHAKPKS